MFIFMVSRGVPTPQDPQWGCFEKDQAEALAAIGHKVVVASVDSRFRFKIRRHGIRHYHINGVDYFDSYRIPEAVTNFLGRNTSIAIRKKQLEKIYRKVVALYGKPDVIYGQFFFNSYIALPLSIRENIPLVTIEHAARFNEDDIDQESLSQSREIYRHTAANIAVADSLRISLAKLFGIQCHVVHNVFGREFGYDADLERRHDKVKFITTGTLTYRKGFDLFIDALAKLNLPKDKWELTIIGAGEEKQHLQQQIDAQHLTENIHLVGSKNKQEIARCLNEHDVFVLPSRNENFSVAVLEALACGLPVIASICGGIRECIDEKNGMLFEVDNCEQLVQCIRYMFEHYSEYDRAAIAADCKARFSAEVIAKKLTDIFRQAING